MTTEPTTRGERSDDLDELRSRVSALEGELADRAERANAALAVAQDRTYWLDRWHVDLNRLMQRPLARRITSLLPLMRSGYRGTMRARQAVAELQSKREFARARGADYEPPAAPTALQRTISPDRLQTAAATERLHARLSEEDLAEIRRRLDREDAATLDTAGPLDKQRYALSFGVHYEVPAVLERTGLTTDAPPDEIHAMGRGSAAAGGSPYYADLVVDALALAGEEPRAGMSVLDFGCSSGRVVRVLAAAYPELRWHGCDPIGPAIAWASEHLPGIDFTRSPEAPPLPYDDAAFDCVYAISIWSHFAEAPALAWLAEMHRVVRPGGLLVLTAHGYQTLAHDESAGMRAPEQLEEIARALYEGGFCFKDEFGEAGDHGITNPGWGTAFLSPEWALANTTRDWLVEAFVPGRVEDNQDLYVLRRR
jgi:SAM-dependent methyltransferase